jgi:enoyl-CoA hydratase/carnithine racemase
VIVLQANGKHFSAGLDIRSVGDDADDGTPPSWTVAQIYGIEAKRFLEHSLRWRNVPKPSIAAVQGVRIAGGLLRCWPCDLIIAAENAKFSDPVVSMGIGGVEYHGHTWEWGARKAKEMLFTGRANQTLDVQGFYAAIQSVFEVHQNGHGNALSESGLPILMQLDGMTAEIGKDKQPAK